MSLPDLSRLAALPAHRLRAFGLKLAALGLTAASVPPALLATAALPPHLRRPVRVFHARKLRGPLGVAMRMFLYEDPVTADEAAAALGDLAAELIDAGLLVRDAGGGVVSPFLLGIMNDLYFLSDNLTAGAGDGAVMGFGDTTMVLCRAAFPARPIESALDLGCGSGTAAILLARCARRVVGTDINPRAIALARVNAAINGAGNVELREGDLFAPVRGEAFDLVVSQPPFVSRPEGVGDAQHVYGGARGDEIALRLLAEIAPHVAPRGRAALFVEWPDLGGAPLDERLRAALGSAELDLLLLRAPSLGLDHQAAAYAAGMHPGLGAAFEREVLARLAHFEEVGIRELCPTLTILERRARGGPPWTNVVPVEAFGRIAPTSGRIDELVQARAIARDRELLLAAALRVPEGTVLTQAQVNPGADVPSKLSATFPPDAMVRPIDMTVELLELVTLVHEAASVREGIARFAEMLETPLDAAMEKAAPAVADALLYGLLEVRAGA